MRLPSRTWTSRPGRFLCVVVLALLGGCAGTSKRDVLESRLRHQEDMLSRSQSQLNRTKTELDIARRESVSLRTQLAENGNAQSSREDIDASFRVAGVAFSTLMTGGTETDGQPGDDGLTVVLVPQDADGELVKIPGTVEIEAFDLSHPSGAQRIGHWQFDAGESHQYWHNGVIQSGYQFELPWQDLPQSEKVLLHGRLVAADGRQFDTTHTIRIDPPDPAPGSPLERGDSIERVTALSDDSSGWPTGAGTKRDKFDVGGSKVDEPNVSPSPAWSDEKPPLFGHAPEDGHRTKSLTGKDAADRLSENEPRRMEWTSPSADDTWYRRADRPVRTSDSWTDETIPRLR